MEPDEDAFKDLSKVIASGLRGWVLAKVLDDSTKAKFLKALNDAYRWGQDDGDNRGYARARRKYHPEYDWRINHQEEWLCDDCFEWVPQSWKHWCELQNPHRKTYELKRYKYKNVDPKGRVTEMEKKR